MRNCSGSLSARRAWIEIVESGELVKQFEVALRKESVDRNALRRGSGLYKKVALRKESVDRNHISRNKVLIQHASLSARRAWIEIIIMIPYYI